MRLFAIQIFKMGKYAKKQFNTLTESSTLFKPFFLSPFYIHVQIAQFGTINNYMYKAQ